MELLKHAVYSLTAYLFVRCPQEKSNLLLFLHQFCDLFWLLLLIAALLSIVTYFFDTSEPINLYVAAILNVIVFTMCVVSYAQAKCTRDVRHIAVI